MSGPRLTRVGHSLLPLRPVAQPRARPWGGSRFTPAADGSPVGELWLAGPDSLVVDPSLEHTHRRGRVDTTGTSATPDPAHRASTITLDALSSREGERFVGRAGIDALGARFPLLVKLIDPGDWLSLQIHPNDEQAREIGDGRSLGKREAWYVIDATDGARLVTGVRRDVDPGEVVAAIERGHVPLELLETIDAVRGEVIHVPPRTLHAIGRGAFLYEIQQPSDLTLRASDWGRPAREDRPLHIEQTLRLIDMAAHAEVVGRAGTEAVSLTTERFRVEVVSSDVELRPAGLTVEVLTVVEGSALIEGDGWLEGLDSFETLVVPASVPAYLIRPAPGARVCVATLP